MTLLSTKEDFLERSLAKIPGMLGKLDYLAELRENGRYAHWGLIHVYGDEVTQRVLAEVHRNLFLQVLRTPLRQLIEDVALSSGKRERAELKAYLESLLRGPRSLAPRDFGGASEAHFNSVAAALLALLSPR